MDVHCDVPVELERVLHAAGGLVLLCPDLGQLELGHVFVHSPQLLDGARLQQALPAHRTPQVGADDVGGEVEGGVVGEEARQQICIVSIVR